MMFIPTAYPFARRRAVRWLTSGIVALTVLMRPAFATVVLPADFTTVVQQSEVIVHGRVVDVRGQMTAGRTSIESVVTLAVIDTLKGAPVRTFVFRTPNGQVGRYRRVVVGAPEFEAGDEVVLFLHGGGPALPTVFGLSQGVFRVTRNAGVPAMVTPPPVVGTAGSAERVIRGDESRRPIPIDDFEQQVRLLLMRTP